MKKFILGSAFMALAFTALFAGDTVTVQTFTFSKSDRSGVYAFPNDPNQKYEKVIMQYSLRCKGGLVSTSANRNLGCGEWDYNCYTYLIDSAKVDSFKNVRPSHDIFNFSGNKFPYTNNKINNYIKRIEKRTIVNSISNTSTAVLGSNGTSLNWLGGNERTQKTQILWKASELSAAGLTAGAIQSMWLNITASGGGLKQLRIKLKSSALTSHSAGSPVLSGFQEVYFINTSFTSTGVYKLNFNSPFVWDGISNIAGEISYTNSGSTSTNIIAGSDVGFNASIMAKESDYYLSFSGNGGQVIELGKNVSITGAKPRTIEGWAYAKNFNDGGIWDAGGKNANGTDFSFRTSTTPNVWRVQTWGAGFDFDVTLPGSQGAWHHYAMVYDGSALMLYYDGALIQKTMEAINTPADQLRLGAWYGNTFDGNIDDIRVWDTVIDPAVIKDWMTRKLSPTHPNYNHLIAYYNMDENKGDSLVDQTGKHAAGKIMNNPEMKLFKGEEAFKQFTETTKRPDITFAQGSYQITNTDSIVYDTLTIKPSRVIAYKVNGTDVTVIDTTYKTAAIGYAYTYNESGAKIDSISITAQDTITITPLNFFTKTPEKIELINFITPYGIGLDLNGLKGKTWEFDVTDYLPVLKGNKFLAVGDAAYQEEMDIRFLFIKGTPPRDVKDVRQIWPSAATRWANYTEIATDAQLEPRNYKLDPNAKAFKIRSQISGHGQGGEFTSLEHSISINGSDAATWTVWNPCADNPIYPQGGTWIYERAGWCPGSAVRLKELEITPLVSPGNNVTFDYTMPNDPGPGDFNYRVNNQLVSYGAANFSLDAGIEYVRNPNTRVEFSRENPMCNNPIVAIKNTGSTKLESLTFSYGLVGGSTKTYNWQGSLNFLEVVEVSLPYIDWSQEKSGQFQVEISKPNGGDDQYADNNKATSSFIKPPVYPASFVMNLTTNNNPKENELTLINADGKILIHKTSLKANTRYSDTLKLSKGCYYVKLTDQASGGGDGLSFWANTAQGSGSFTFNKVTGGTLKTFNPDFGSITSWQFYVTDTTYISGINPIKSAANLSLNLYPNPARDMLWFETNLETNTPASLQIIDVMGRLVGEEKLYLIENNTPISVAIRDLRAGIYQAVLTNGTQKISKRFSVIH